MGFSLGEQVDITQVMDLKQRLRDEIEKSDSLEIEAGDVGRVDAPGLQLLLAARNASLGLSKEWKWNKVSDELIGAAKTLGLIEPLGLDDFA